MRGTQQITQYISEVLAVRKELVQCFGWVQQHVVLLSQKCGVLQMG